MTQLKRRLSKDKNRDLRLRLLIYRLRAAQRSQS